MMAPQGQIKQEVLHFLQKVFTSLKNLQFSSKITISNTVMIRQVGKEKKINLLPVQFFKQEI